MFSPQTIQPIQITSFNSGSYYNNNTFSLLLKKKKKRSPFSPEEDLLLKNLVENSKIINWSEIASCIPGRNSRQCRDRYQHYLDPSVTHGNWTQEEDELILKLYEKNGPCWALMSLYLKGRNNNSIKNRYNNHLKNGNIQYTQKNNENQCDFPPKNNENQSKENPVHQIEEDQTTLDFNDVVLFDDMPYDDFFGENFCDFNFE